MRMRPGAYIMPSTVLDFSEDMAVQGQRSLVGDRVQKAQPAVRGTAGLSHSSASEELQETSIL